MGAIQRGWHTCTPGADPNSYHPCLSESPNLSSVSKGDHSDADFLRRGARWTVRHARILHRLFLESWWCIRSEVVFRSRFYHLVYAPCQWQCLFFFPAPACDRVSTLSLRSDAVQCSCPHAPAASENQSRVCLDPKTPTKSKLSITSKSHRNIKYNK